jgi:hypothetical protein
MVKTRLRRPPLRVMGARGYIPVKNYPVLPVKYDPVLRSQTTVIAEFPDEEFQTSLQAIEATFERVRAKEYAGWAILLSGQSYEADGEQYRMIDVLYEDGAFKFRHPVPDVDLVARFARIPPERVAVLGNGRAITIQMGSPSELTRFLDRLYRASFSIRLLPDEDSYNFVSEVIGDGDHFFASGR